MVMRPTLLSASLFGQLRSTLNITEVAAYSSVIISNTPYGQTCRQI